MAEAQNVELNGRALAKFVTPSKKIPQLRDSNSHSTAQFGRIIRTQTSGRNYTKSNKSNIPVESTL